MKVSAIIPVFNVEPYLQRCIGSVAASAGAADRECEFEFVCVDDGSTDGSSAILAAAARGDGRFTVIRQENRGLAAARNTGLEAATGDFIAFIDSDDSVEHGFFPELLSAIRRTGRDVAACGTGDCTAEDYWCRAGCHPAAAWGKLYAAALWRDLRFPEGRLHEDEFTIHKAVFAAGAIAGAKKKLYRYSARQGSITHTPGEKRLRDWLDGCSEQAEFLKPLSRRAYAEALAKKIQVEHWLGRVSMDDVAEYSRAAGGRIGNYYWAEHYRHPMAVNRLSWKVLSLLRRFF